MEGHTDDVRKQALSSGEVVVAIATPLEAELVETIRAVDGRMTIGDWRVSGERLSRRSAGAAC